MVKWLVNVDVIVGYSSLVVENKPNTTLRIPPQKTRNNNLDLDVLTNNGWGLSSKTVVPTWETTEITRKNRVWQLHTWPPANHSFRWKYGPWFPIIWAVGDLVTIATRWTSKMEAKEVGTFTSIPDLLHLTPPENKHYRGCPPAIYKVSSNTCSSTLSDTGL